LGHAHGLAPSARKEKLRTGTYASQNSSLTDRNHPQNWTFGTWEGEGKWGCEVETRRFVRAFGTTPYRKVAWAKMTQQWDTTVSDDEKPSEKARAIRARQRAIGRELRRMYDDVAQEPVPDDFLDLLRQIDESDERGSAEEKGGKKVS
jgi:hypothetical protein